MLSDSENQANATPATESVAHEHALEIWCVGEIDANDLAPQLKLPDGTHVVTRRLHRSMLSGALASFAPQQMLAVVYLPYSGRSEDIGLAELIRQHAQFRQTRLYLVAHSPELAGVELEDDSHDIEHVLSLPPTPAAWQQTVSRGVSAYRAHGSDSTNGYYFLDTKYNEVFSWFERTRWSFNELPDFSEIRPELLSPQIIKLVKHAAIAEFGTLPGAHNFLREWADDISFSNWALSWGAEESRHSLVLCRYLRAIGVEVMSKHALYKRHPYDPGPTRASTLMMNMISESRAAVTYERVANTTQEPVAKKIFTLLSRDEARHASAFAQFCKEQCAVDERNRVSAMEQAYFWLAQQSGGGFRHPAGEFYPHTQTAEGFSDAEAQLGKDGTDSGDETVLRMIRKIMRDDSLRSARDIKRWLRDRSEPISLKSSSAAKTQVRISA